MPLNLSRSLLAVLVPGLLSVMPWAIYFGFYFESLRHTYQEFPFVLNVMGFAIIVVVGAFCQSVGSYIEPKWDEERESEFNVDHNWYEYLALRCRNEAVGFRYISRLANSLYFELPMMTGGFLFSAGSGILLAALFHDFMFLWLVVGLLSGISLTCWFRKQAKDTHQTLCITRRELVDRLRDNQE